MPSFRRKQSDPATQRATGEHQTPAGNMLPARRRSAVERVFVRLVATGGIIGIGVGIGAILASNNVQGWIIGLAVAAVSVVLAAVLWSSRQL